MGLEGRVLVVPRVVSEFLLAACSSPLLVLPAASGRILPFRFRRQPIRLSSALAELSDKFLDVVPRHVFDRASQTTIGFSRRVGPHRPGPLHLRHWILADIKVLHAYLMYRPLIFGAAAESVTHLVTTAFYQNHFHRLKWIWRSDWPIICGGRTVQYAEGKKDHQDDNNVDNTMLVRAR